MTSKHSSLETIARLTINWFCRINWLGDYCQGSRMDQQSHLNSIRIKTSLIGLIRALLTKITRLVIWWVTKTSHRSKMTPKTSKWGSEIPPHNKRRLCNRIMTNILRRWARMIWIKRWARSVASAQWKSHPLSQSQAPCRECTHKPCHVITFRQEDIIEINQRTISHKLTRL